MTREEKLALAGDYVLGLLDETERAACEVVMGADSELAEMVAHLSERMHSLDATATPEPFVADLWARIEHSIDGRAKAPEVIVPIERGNRPSAKWRPIVQPWLPMAASVVVALGVGYLAGISMRPSDQPTVIAIMLNQSDGSPAVIVEAFADDSVRLVPLESFAAPEGQVLQVWTLPDVETGPVSLGTLSEAHDLRLNGPNLPVPHDGQLYEITLEPAPGSPTGRPTGPILVKGFAKPPV